MNDYVEKHGDSKGVFLVTQYFVNGYVPEEKFDADLGDIRSGKEFSTEDGLKC